MRQILFIHSAGPQGAGQGSDVLLAYIREHMGKSFEIIAPAMPEPDQPEYIRWKMKLSHNLQQLKDDALLIGHSLGGSVLMKYLTEEEPDKRFGGLFVIASPFWGKENWKVKEYILQRDFGAKLSEMIAHVYLYHSHDDEIVPFDHLRQYQKKIPSSTVRKVEGGHCFEKTGLPELIADIRSIAS